MTTACWYPEATEPSGARWVQCLRDIGHLVRNVVARWAPFRCTHVPETCAVISGVFKLIDTPARRKKCDAIEGILAEAKKHMADIKNNAVLDAPIIGSAQAVEHYEITRYGTLIAWANQLGKQDAADLLERNLEEEKHADELLTEIAVTSANQKAAA